MSSSKQRGIKHLISAKHLNSRSASAGVVRAQEELAWKIFPCLTIILGGIVLGLQMPWLVTEGRHFSWNQILSQNTEVMEMTLVSSPEPVPVISQEQQQEINAPIEPPPLAVTPPHMTRQHISIEPIVVQDMQIPALPPYEENAFAMAEAEFFPETMELPTQQQETKIAKKSNSRSKASQPKSTQSQRLASKSTKKAQQKQQTSASAGLIAKTRPSYRSAPKPPFPPSLRSRQAEGTVRVRISVDSSGKPTEVSIVSSSGHHELDSTARNWILNRWSFFPATENGHAIASRVTTKIEFTLDS